ncbi:kinase non-catalytic C-lobe domain-containing protein 1 isoform X7 [Rhinatrema bivittatum]|uniref:kinase non-catalytic C-lobe domain-containing protein 1 isoform X7 n=1 Tax=Rhinatrema bivittatum TaxID=194408 RepID=UPI00112B0BD8|nr:kinase non-catalytic C-lobe domain-containing protein 1 isoform X7 [Rhinatrema bivittatum]
MEVAEAAWEECYEEKERGSQDLYDFEPLPTLLEDEENVSLADILSLRESCLTEQDIWAICLECSYSLKSISHATIFQTLCITPDTLAFNTNGNVCFMEQLSDDPEGAFVPPEFDITGNTYEAHVYSLGATLKAAIDFVIEPEVEPEFCQDLKTLLEQMQQENPADRPDIESIISLCELKMNCSTSCSICRNLSAVGRRVLSIESVNSFQDGYKNTWKIKHQTDTEVKLQRKDVAESVLSAAEDYASKSYLNGCVNNMPLDDGDCEYGLNEIAIKMDRERNHEHSKYRNHYKELEMKSFSEKYDSILETEQCDDDFGRLILKKSLISKPQSFPKDPVQYSEKRNILTSESDNGMFTKKSWSSASELLSLNNIKDVGFCNICLQIKSQPKCCQVSCLNSEVTDSHECTQLSNIFKEKYPSVLKEKAEFSLGCCTNEFCLVSAETPIVEAACEVPGHLIAGREVLGKDSSTSEDHAQTSILLNANFLSQINCKSLLLKDDTKEKECKAHQINSLHSSMLHRSDDKENFDGDRQSEIINDEPQWISLKDLLSWYGRPLKEYELWALCHECLCSLQTYINYPAYLSLDTVMIDSHGEVLFSVPEDADCYDAFSMAPEFEEQGLVTEKVCVYGVAAILWTAAKYNFSPNRKLSLPKKLKKLLLNMAKRNANDRLSLTDALKICQEYLFQQGINSKTVWSQLSRCAYQQNEEAILGDCVSLVPADKHDKEGSLESIVGEYIFALKGLQFGTFVGAISEKFCDLYWNETFLENLYTAVNGKTPSLLRIAKGVSTMSSTSQNSKRNSTSPAKKKTKTKKVEKQSNHAQLSLVHHEESVCITFPLLDVPFQTDGSQETVTLNAGKETQVASESAISSTVDLCFDGIDFKEFLPDNIEKEYRPLHPLLGTEIKEHPIESNFLQDDTFSLNPDFKDMDGQNAEDMLIRTIKTLGVMPACTADTYRCNPGWSSAFYGAGCFHPDVQSYVKKLGMQKKNEIPSIEAKKLELQQQLMIETKNYRKTIKFYQKLMQKEKVNKDSEIRTMLAKLKGQLEEMKSKVQFLELVKKYLQVTYAELWGLEQCAVPTVVNITQCEMEYRHPEETSLLIFYSEKEHKGDRYNKSKILQAGTPLGLMAYLYTRNAVLEGYVQQFLYTFRYFCTRQDFLQFLIGRANCALSRENLDSSSTLAKIYNRTLYLLQAWIEDCYIVDFSTNTDLLDNLEDFIYSRLIPMDSRGEQLLSLLKDITRKKDECTSPCLSFVQQKDEDTKSLHSLCTKFSEDNISRKSLNWKFSKGNESILLHQKEKQYTIASALPRPCYPNFMEEFSSSYMKVDERGSYFISEYSVQQLSSQLTLLQEKMFQKCHPVHFLNSRVLGVKDRVTIATKTVTTRAFPAEASSLFVQNCIQDNYLLQLLRYGDNISTWVAAEIVTCHTSKLQANFLSKFLLIAKSCYEQRDFATAMQILGGLENLMVRQLPVWKNLPSKISKILEELKAIKVFLKSDSLCLMEGDKFKTLPTIPSAHLLAMHVQQLETGGFTNVNGTFKWTKLRHIAKVVSQVHAFQEIPYTLTPDPELQYHLRQRFAYFSGADISVLAADNNTNFYQIPAGKYCRRIQDTLCRMKATFQ